MAEFSGDEQSCLPPSDFQLSTESLDERSSEQLVVDLFKCPLCHKSRKNFYCRQCVQKGEFTSSKVVYSDRFVDKQQRLARLKIALNQLEDRCTKALEKHKQRNKLICDINSCKERMKMLKEAEAEIRKNIVIGNQKLQVLKEFNSKIVSKLPRHKEQIEKLNKLVHDLDSKQKVQKEIIERKKEQLKNIRRVSVKQLIKYIFPISKVEPTESSCSSEDSISDSTDLLTYAIADASGTSYIRGKWINDTENNSQVKYRIVEPTLPGSGDYSTYSLYARNKDEPVNKENMMHNPAHNITAALAYATQLVNVLAYYLNVRLPYKLAYGEFYQSEMSDQKFARKVAKLNSNILHLCFTQNTDTKVLHPMHTLQNLMHLLNTEISDLGRMGPIEVDQKEAAHLYKQLAPDLENRDGSVSDEDEDVINWEWEAVPNISCPEMDIPIPGAMTSQQSSHIQVNQSVAGGLVTSAAASIVSIWRGWTTNK